MNDEIRFHVEREAERIAREERVAPDEARRRALAAFGGIEKHKEHLRHDRGGSWLAGLSLDLKLGVRMLVKYPGLTIVGVVGMSVGVAIGATGFAVIGAAVGTDLPLADGDRIIAFGNVGAREADRLNLPDIAEWRALRGVELIGAFRTVARNLITPSGAITPLRAVEMNASGFTLAGVQPMFGRYLVVDDEREDAPPVVVIGHTIWQRTFFNDSAIVGKTLRLGDTERTIVGVMPPGFAFPVNNSVWTPLQLNVADYALGRAPVVEVFARMTPGTKLDEIHAQAEALSARLYAGNPAERRNVTGRAMSYAHSFFGVRFTTPAAQLMINMARVFMSLILIVIGTNVAILVYARTAGRTGEIGLRSALGASRLRIVGQFFAEALVLSSAAAAVGLVVSHMVLRYAMAWIDRVGGEQLAFWIRLRLTPSTVLYVAGLAVVAAVIVGVIPALKATQRQITSTLQQLSTGGSGLRLGRIWNGLIVAQVAVTVALMPIAVYSVGSWILLRAPTPTIPVSEMLTASLYLDQPGAGTNDFASYATDEFRSRFAALQSDVGRALRADPSVASATFATSTPGSEDAQRIEIDTVGGPVRSDSAIAANRPRSMLMGGVEPGHFEALGITPLSGRLFAAGDAAERPHVAIVNRSFVRKELGDGPAVGRRIRAAGRSDDWEVALRTGSMSDDQWLEIVGVVPDMPHLPADPEDPNQGRSRVYVPLRLGDGFPATIVVRVRTGTPATFVPRLREITTKVNPMLRLGSIEPLARTLEADAEISRVFMLVVVVIAVAVLSLSAAGIYALMSFTITRRRREIGIRTALGAGAGRVVRAVLTRATVQIGAGIAIGLLLSLPIDKLLSNNIYQGWGVVIPPTVVAIMLVIGFVSAVGPVRRALSIQPTEALRGD